VRTALAAAGGPPPLDSALRSRTLSIVNHMTNGAAAPITRGPAMVDGELAEETMTANEVAVTIGAEMPSDRATRGLFGNSQGFTPEEKQILRPHVVDLRLGAFSNGGTFQTSLADVQRIFNELLPAELEQRRSEGQPLRLVFYAHGGLVSEEDGIRPVLRRLPFWRQNGLYPIFFCWETGLKETVGDLIAALFQGQRGLVSDAKDAVLESIAGPGGREVWSAMKRSAELASMQGGGARAVAELTRDFWADHHADMELHAVGHSAGAIFHAFFLPTLLDLKPGAGVPPLKVKSLHFLAPACTTTLFESKLKPRIGPKEPIVAHTMYTMNKDLEQDDTAGPYGKSLLYLVSNAFEDQKPTPILGLEESLRDDPALIRFYGLARTIPGVAQILFSKTAPAAPLDSATESTSHGDFDNEVKTMNSVARRILDRPVGTIASFQDETSRSEVARALRSAPAVTPVAAGASGASSVAATRVAAAARAAAGAIGSNGAGVGAGARRALCIGIDSYPAPNALGGCVNDARSWTAALQALQFDVSQLLNQQATREAILNGMRDLIATSSAGDVIVIQYAGHGTTVLDLDGDEATGNDQALVPIDFEGGQLLIDDDIRTVMQGIPGGVNVTCFMDCCFSGSNTRLFAPTPPRSTGVSRTRFLPLTPEVTQAYIDARNGSGNGNARALAPAARLASGMREINFAACLPTEPANETNGAGDFTSRAVRILSGGIDGLTNADFQARVLDAFGTVRRQTPFLDCASSALALPLLVPFVRTAMGSTVSTVGIAATANGSSAAAARADAGDRDAALLMERLEAIERRLARLGA
jgi:hypothetical protein